MSNSNTVLAEEPVVGGVTNVVDGQNPEVVPAVFKADTMPANTPDTDLLVKAVTDFVNAVELDKSMKLLGTQVDDEGKECFIISYDDGQGAMKVTVTVSSICLNADKEDYAAEVVACIKNERVGIVLEGVSRIVGYFSRMKNWNASKSVFGEDGNLKGGELLDRHNDAKNYHVS